MRFSIADGKSLSRQKKEKSFKTIYNILAPVAAVYFWRLKQHLSHYPALLFPPPRRLFSFVSSPPHSIFPQSAASVSGAGTGQGQENDNIRSFSGQIRSAATCRLPGAHARERTALMDERSHTKDVNMIHGSFVGISPTHIHANVRARSRLVLVSQKYTLLSTHFLYNARWIPPLALH